MTICERMFEIMDAKGISAYYLCKDLGLRTSTVSNWKKRKTHLAGTSDLLRVLGISEDDAESISRIDRGILLAEEVVPICKYFGCTVKFLLTGEEEQRGSLFGVQLDKDSRTLLEIYDSLPDREQGILLGEAKGMLYSCEDKGDTGNPKSSAGKAV